MEGGRHGGLRGVSPAEQGGTGLAVNMALVVVLPMLPTHEIDTLTMTVNHSVGLAAEGKVADGYACLVWGLQRAEEIVEEGIDCDEGLVTRWPTAVENYCTRYGVTM